MPSRHVYRRRLDFRFSETEYYIKKFLETGSELAQDEAIGHARTLWAMALRISRRDVEELRKFDA